MFNKQILRSIRGSLGRFIAILLITALGCGFYAGLRMTGHDMRLAADAWYDGTQLFDLQVLCNLGFTQDQVDEIAKIEGVEAVMPSRTVDVMTTLSESQYVMRLSQLDTKAAQGSVAEAPNLVVSDDDSYLNRLVLEEGSWPDGPGEAVLSADRVMNSSVQIGDVVQVDYGASDLDDVLKTREYRVVGLAHSSLYTSDSSMGNTTLGSGKIQQYMYVDASNFDADYPFTEVYLRVVGASDLFSGGDEYQARVDEVAARLEDASGRLGNLRYQEIRDEAQKKVDEGWDEYEEAKREADEKLADAKAELDDALAQLEQAEADLAAGEAKAADGEAQLADGEAELAAGKKDAAAGEKKWNQQKGELQDKKAEAEEGLEQAQSGLKEAQAGKKQAEEAITQAEEGIAAADAGIAQIEATIAELEAQQDQLATGIEQAEAGLAQAQAALEAAEASGDAEAIAKAKAVVEQAQAALDDLQGKLAQVDAGIDQAQASLAEVQEKKAQAEEGLAQAQEGKKQAEEGIATAEKGIEEATSGIKQIDEGIKKGDAAVSSGKKKLSEAESKLESSRDELAAGWAEVADGRAKLADGWAEYNDGLAEYNKARDDADKELADARRELEEAQDDIEALDKPEVYILDRTKNFGVQSVQADSERIDNIASVFPFVFFLVAALVALTTMTRMIDEERQLIGTFKALGYSKRRITRKYLLYAGLASGAGAVIGIAILAQVLPSIIANAYGIIYNVPQPEGLLAYDLPVSLLAGALGVGITLLATWAAAGATLRETPAALMLPPAPTPGKRILLERIHAVWNRLSFSWKVSFRNLFRYKKRFWMTIIGLAGCTALLVTGFGLHNAIWDIIDKQYGPILRYNVQVQLEDDAPDTATATVLELLQDKGAARATAIVATENMQVGSESADTRGVTITVPRTPSDLLEVVHMQVRETGEPVPFDDSSVVVTEKLARTLGVGIGSPIQLYEQDTIGNAVGSPSELTITGIMENYVGDQVYVGKKAFRKAVGTPLVYDSLLSDTDHAHRTELNDALMANKDVQTVSFNDEVIDTYRTMLQSVNIIVVVLVVAAALLSFIVLYNLVNINITERRREIASLKVLGFTPREVNAYIFREVMLLTLIGAALGLVLGISLEGFVVTTAEVDYVMFGREIHAWSFGAAFALTVVFTCVVMLFMGPKLAAIDMVESLKSVE